MSTSTHPIIILSDSDVEDAFSSTNTPDYTPASPDYSPASPGNTSSDPSEDSVSLSYIKSNKNVIGLIKLKAQDMPSPTQVEKPIRLHVG
ncbi:hypothetical protein Tco_1038102 [Tanacetum coccineum]